MFKLSLIWLLRLKYSLQHLFLSFLLLYLFIKICRVIEHYFCPFLPPSIISFLISLTSIHDISPIFPLSLLFWLRYLKGEYHVIFHFCHPIFAPGPIWSDFEFYVYFGWRRQIGNKNPSEFAKHTGTSLIKGSVSWDFKWVMLYINWKLFSRAIVGHHKILILLKGHFTIYKRGSSVRTARQF